MTSTYTANGKVEKPGAGDYPGGWATPVNTGLDLLDDMIAGTETVNLLSATTYSLAALGNGTDSESRAMRLKFTGTPASAVTVTVPASVTSKMYVLDNQCGKDLTLKYAATTGVTVPTGTKTICFADGTTVTEFLLKPRYDTTAAEIAASVTPTSYFYASGPVYDLRRIASFNGTDESAKLQAAIDMFANSTSGIGRIIVPEILCVNSTVTVKGNVTVDFMGKGIKPLSNIDVIKVSQGGCVENINMNLAASAIGFTYTSKYLSLVPSAQLQGGKWQTWARNIRASGESQNGTLMYVNGLTQMIDRVMAHDISGIDWGQLIYVDADPAAIKYVSAKFAHIVGENCNYTIREEGNCVGNTYLDVTTEGQTPGVSTYGTIKLQSLATVIGGKQWDRSLLILNGDGIRVDCPNHTTYGNIQDNGTSNLVTSNGALVYYDGRSIGPYGDHRAWRELRGQVEFWDDMLGGMDPRWAADQTNGTRTYVAQEFGGASSDRVAGLAARLTTNAVLANELSYKLGGNPFVLVRQQPRVFVTLYRNTASWRIDLFADNNNFIRLEVDSATYSDNVPRLVTKASGTATTTKLTGLTDTTGLVYYARLVCKAVPSGASSVVATVASTSTTDPNVGVGAIGQIEEHGVTVTHTTNIPTVALVPRIASIANAASAQFIDLLEYGLVYHKTKLA